MPAVHSKKRRGLPLHACALAAIFVACSPLSSAETVGGEITGGDAFVSGGTLQIIAAPAVLGNNAFDDDNVRAFDEVQDLTLSANLIMDLYAADLSSNVLGAGSVVSSHYVIFDPASTRSAIGTVTFDEPVLGVIISNIRFDDTDDLLGNPGTSYAIGNQQLDPQDSVAISGNTINFDLLTSSPGDAIRVITGTDPVFAYAVCEPAEQTISGTITGGDALSNGGQFRQICDPIGAVGNDNFDSYDLFGFEEQQAVELAADLFLDATTVVPAGEFVSSYYIVWDPVPTNRVVATLTFADTIIGVISDEAQLLDSEFLGDASAQYLNPDLLGLEAGDTFTINGAELSINFTAGSPGDSVRVILGSASPSLSYNVCDAQDMTVSGSVTGGSAASNGGTFLQLCEPIGPIGNDNLQANDLFAFEEAQNSVLEEALELDDPPATSLAAGTLVSSYYVAFDPGATKNIVGSVTFPNTILGLATSIDNLNASDLLGSPTAVYLNPSLRGLEANDFASFSGDTLSVTLDADSPGDYLRVFVAVDDGDGDGIADSVDNCTAAANADQRDTNSDGYGNACDADLNNDCIVNAVDLGLFRSVFFSDDDDADFNGDGVVNAGDLGILRLLFFQPPGPSDVGTGC